MDSMSYRNNRPAGRPAEPESAAAVPQPSTAPVARSKRSSEAPKSNRRFIMIVVLVAVLIAAAAAWFLLGRSGTATAIDSSKYQAVFFTNGQVYFGKLSQLNDDYMRLKSVYYLQNKEQAENEATPQSASKQDASDVELIKLGNEIHGPEDEMLVSKDQILFFENLKPAGTVSQTISNFQKSNQ